MFNKPNYIDQKFVEATKSGWVDKRTGEILVALPNLLERIAALSPVVPNEPPVVPVEVITEPTVESIVDQSMHTDSLTELLDVFTLIKDVKVESEPTEDVKDEPTEAVVVETTGDLVINLTEENVSIESKNEDENPVDPVKKRRGRPSKK